ncbi:hypothetical protein [Streptomyces sp. NPDC058424]|uniref:hypothetical protein n=1 Tax=Streptomyces sp. NPDC058424 TaxID=3346491 RepID=UPI00364F65C6
MTVQDVSAHQVPLDRLDPTGSDHHGARHVTRTGEATARACAAIPALGGDALRA